MQLFCFLCVMGGLVGVCLSRSVPALGLPVSLPASAFNWPNNDYQQASEVDELGYAVTQNPGRIEPRQLLNPNTEIASLALNGVEYVDDLSSLNGARDNFFLAKTEQPFSGRNWMPKRNGGPYVFVVLQNQNNNNNSVTTETTTAATTRLGDFVPAGYYRAPPPSYGVPMQYFRTHQDQSQLLGWNDLSSFGGGIGGGSASGGVPRVPLVPISLPNNQVGYVPLNLRMFRQLAATLPIRENAQQSENEQQAQQNPQQLTNENQEDDQEDDVPLAMLALQPNDDSLAEPQRNPSSNDASALPSDAETAGNFSFLGQRLRSQRPSMAARNPFQAIAKNMKLRRVQYV